MATLKGAFIEFGGGPLGALPNIIVFQFNPDKVTRTPSLAAQPPTKPDRSCKRPASQQPDEPNESISFTLRLDATDQLARTNPIALEGGILPALSAIELLMVPRPSPAADLARLSGSKSKPHQHPPEKVPNVLFFWGPFRILPVSVKSLSITETEYDTRLNPVRAEVSINLDVLTPTVLGDSQFSSDAYEYSQSVKVAMAALNLANAAELGVRLAF